MKLRLGVNVSVVNLFIEFLFPFDIERSNSIILWLKQHYINLIHVNQTEIDDVQYQQTT